MKILDTCFGKGARFLHHWADWKASAPLSGSLHYVAIIQNTADLAGLAVPLSADPCAPDIALAHQLSDQCWGLLPGFHRLGFENSRVLLTLCVGDLKSQAKALRFEADLLILSAPATSTVSGQSPWDLWDIKALARCCRLGTSVWCETPSFDLSACLRQTGFDMAPPDASGCSKGTYAPHWRLKNSASPIPQKRQRAVVLGAGLAGASLAASLARRGWQVTVLDSQPQPAGAASGLPVGLMAPHVTTDDDLRSRLSRCGLRMTLQEADKLLVRGQDWNISGVLERRLDGSPGLPVNWPTEGAAWSRPLYPVAGPWRAGLADDDVALWHAHGGWVKPARLVNAWLAQPGIRFQGGSHVANIHRQAGQWSVTDAADTELARGDVVILANAVGAIALLNRLSGALPEERRLARVKALLQTVEGQVSWALQDDADTALLPPFPVNGLGSLIPHIPFDGARAWFAGATFERDGQALDIANAHKANQQRVEALLPASGQLFARQHLRNEVQAWRNMRCTAMDRMPVCGPLTAGHNPGLWINTALGARGLSLSVLCAELLAARLCDEPWPLEAKLAQSIDSMR